MTKTTLSTLALGAAILASCTLEKDAQHGISFEFQHPNQRSRSEVKAEPARTAVVVAAEVGTPAPSTQEWVAAPNATYAPAANVWSALSADSYSAPELATTAERGAAATEVLAEAAPVATDEANMLTEANEVVVPAKKAGWFQRLVQRVAAPDNEMVIALLLAVFLGGFGAHWFYLGERGKGMVRLIISLVSGLLYIAGYIMAAIAVSAGGTGILGGLLFLLGLLGILAVSVLVIIDIINILTDNW
jgi:TM2 domain-containing membrane protein YozV